VSFNTAWGEARRAPCLGRCGCCSSRAADATAGRAVADGSAAAVSVPADPDAAVAALSARGPVHEGWCAGLGNRFGRRSSTGTSSHPDLHIARETIAHEAIGPFCPGVFKLTRRRGGAPSFEPAHAGLRWREPRPGDDRRAVAIKTTEYETFYIDEPGGAGAARIRSVKPPLATRVLLPFGAPSWRDRKRRGGAIRRGNPIRVRTGFVVLTRARSRHRALPCGRRHRQQPARA